MGWRLFEKFVEKVVFGIVFVFKEFGFIIMGNLVLFLYWDNWYKLCEFYFILCLRILVFWGDDFGGDVVKFNKVWW